MRRLIALCFVFIMTVGMVTVSASPAGSVNDPLISRSHLEGAFASSLQGDVRAALSGAADQALSRLNQMYLEAAGYSFAGRFTPVSVSSGNSISLGPGSSFILTSGTASLSVQSGVVVNVSTGNVTASGSALSLNQRFFCTENTAATITSSMAFAGYVDGFFYISGVNVTSPPTNQPPTHVPVPPVSPNPPFVPHPPIVSPDRPLPFTDVPSGAWFRAAVSFAFQNELFAGTSATTFSPNDPMTRGMFVTVLHRLDGSPAPGGFAAFSDVRDSSAFFYRAVSWAAENNIVGGFDDGTFRPNMPITREQMASIMHRYAQFRGRNLNSSAAALDAFPDRAGISVFAVEPMRWAVSWNIIRGGSDGALMPRSTATRAQVAQIVLNYVEQIGR